MALMDILQTLIIVSVGFAIVYYVLKLSGLGELIMRVLSGRKMTKEERLQKLREKYKRIKESE